MRKNSALIISLIAIVFLLFPCISIAKGERPIVWETEKMSKQRDMQSKATSQLPMKGVGCWVQKTSLNNPYINSDVFGWYVVDVDIIDSFNTKLNKPLFISFGKKNDADFF